MVSHFERFLDELHPRAMAFWQPLPHCVQFFLIRGIETVVVVQDMTINPECSSYQDVRVFVVNHSNNS